MQIGKDQEAAIKHMMAQEWWNVMRAYIDDLINELLTQLRSRNPEYNKVAFTQHDQIRLLIDQMENFIEAPIEFIEKTKDVYNLEDEI